MTFDFDSSAGGFIASSSTGRLTATTSNADAHPDDALLAGPSLAAFLPSHSVSAINNNNQENAYNHQLFDVDMRNYNSVSASLDIPGHLPSHQASMPASSYESYLHYPDAANQFLFTVTDADSLDIEDSLFLNTGHDFNVSHGGGQARLHAYSLPNNLSSAFKPHSTSQQYLDLPHQFYNFDNHPTTEYWIDDYAHTVSPSDLQSVSSASNLFDETLSVTSRSSLKRNNNNSHNVDTNSRAVSGQKKQRASAASDSTALGRMMSSVGLLEQQSTAASPTIQSVFVDSKGLRYSLTVEMNGCDKDFSYLYTVPQTPPRQHSSLQINEWLSRPDTSSDSRSVAGHAMKLYAAVYDTCEEGTDPDSVVTIYAPRIGQKSYGTEKRLFCPPPMVHITGSEFILGTKIHASTDATGIKFNEACGGVSSFVDGSEYKASTLFTAANSGDSEQLALFRAMFISDLSKVRNSKSSYDHVMYNQTFAKLFSDIGVQRIGKDFELHLRVNHGEHLGTFVSDTINIISKPSKKKVGSAQKASSTPKMKNRKSIIERNNGASLNELIYSGTAIALYNRLKSQTVSTKYLTLNQNDDGSLFKPVAKSTFWQSFVIKSCHHLAGNKILYDSPVFLECPTTGWKSDVFIVRRVETKEQVVLPTSSRGEEAVLQLQKIALQSAKDSTLFLSIHPKTLEIHYIKSTKVACRIVDEQQGGTSSSDDMSLSPAGSGNTLVADKISDHCIWSAVAVSKTTYRYFRANVPRSLTQHDISLPVTPIPKLVSCHVVDGNSKYHLIDMNVFFSASGILEALDVLYHRQSQVSMQNQSNLLRYLEHDIYIGSVKCEIVQRMESFLTESGKVIATSILNNENISQVSGTSLSILMNKIVCRVPSLSTLVDIDGDEQSDGGMSLKISEADLSDGFTTVIEDLENNTTQIQLPIIMVRKLDGMVYRLGRYLKFTVFNPHL